MAHKNSYQSNVIEWNIEKSNQTQPKWAQHEIAYSSCAV